MNLFGLAPDRVAARVHHAGDSVHLPTLSESLIIGASGFCFTSLLVFATVALGERWMYRHLGWSGAYLTWTALFMLVGGALLSPLVIGPQRLVRFYLLFSAAFLLYSIGWIAAYFTLRGKTGEWLGSLVGTVLMGLVLALAFDAARHLPKLILILFVSNSLGYFLGDFCNSAIKGKTGMLLWGACFGVGLGAGLGYALYLAQTPIRERLSEK